MQSRNKRARFWAALIILTALFMASAISGPTFPDKVPAQQNRDSVGAAKFAYYCQGVTP